VLEDLARQEERLPSQRVEVTFDAATEADQGAQGHQGGPEPEPQRQGPQPGG